MSKTGKRILKSVRKARTSVHDETGKIADVFGCLKKPGRRALSVEQMNRIATCG